MSEHMSSKDRFKMKHFIKELENFKGRHTELVSVYVPSGYDLNKVINHLQQEQGTASNIKSKGTRDNVIAALEKMIQHLKLVQTTPANGLVAFAGNVTEREGQQDYRVWSLEPPMQMNQRLYRCDKEFILEPLQDMIQSTAVYGLVAMDRREATIALLKGKNIQTLVNTESMVPGKFRAGGQSALRFERNRELAAKEFYRKIGDHLKEQFMHMENLKGIIVGGPGPTKYEFVEGNNIITEVKKKILAIKDTTYTGDFGIQELLDKSQDVLANEEVAEEKKEVQKFFNLLATKPNMVTYGKEETWKQLQFGVVDTLLLSEQLDDETIAKFEEEAEKYSTNVAIISVETREGVQLSQIGRVASILRYEVHQE